MLCNDGRAGRLSGFPDKIGYIAVATDFGLVLGAKVATSNRISY